jgi:hypothetical protein
MDKLLAFYDITWPDWSPFHAPLAPTENETENDETEANHPNQNEHIHFDGSPWIAYHLFFDLMYPCDFSGSHDEGTTTTVHGHNDGDMDLPRLPTLEHPGRPQPTNQSVSPFEPAQCGIVGQSKKSHGCHNDDRPREKEQAHEPNDDNASMTNERTWRESTKTITAASAAALLDHHLDTSSNRRCRGRRTTSNPSIHDEHAANLSLVSTSSCRDVCVSREDDSESLATTRNMHKRPSSSASTSVSALSIQDPPSHPHRSSCGPQLSSMTPSPVIPSLRPPPPTTIHAPSRFRTMNSIMQEHAKIPSPSLTVDPAQAPSNHMSLPSNASSPVSSSSKVNLTPEQRAALYMTTSQSMMRTTAALAAAQRTASSTAKQSQAIVNHAKQQMQAKHEDRIASQARNHGNTFQEQHQITFTDVSTVDPALVGLVATRCARYALRKALRAADTDKSGFVGMYRICDDIKVDARASPHRVFIIRYESSCGDR